MIEHIIIVMQCVMSAVPWSMNRQSIMGIIAKGKINTLIPPCPMIMPTIIGNIVAERVVKMNFLLLVAMSVRYMYMYAISTNIQMIMNSACPRNIFSLLLVLLDASISFVIVK